MRGALTRSSEAAISPCAVSVARRHALVSFMILVCAAATTAKLGAQTVGFRHIDRTRDRARTAVEAWRLSPAGQYTEGTPTLHSGFLVRGAQDWFGSLDSMPSPPRDETTLRSRGEHMLIGAGIGAVVVAGVVGLRVSRLDQDEQLWAGPLIAASGVAGALAGAATGSFAFEIRRSRRRGR